MRMNILISISTMLMVAAIVKAADLDRIRDNCLVTVRSHGFDDDRCDSDIPERCAVVNIQRADGSNFDFIVMLAPDSETNEKRGLVVTTFDPMSCDPSEHIDVPNAQIFDTHKSESRSGVFQHFVESQREGTIVLLMTAGEYTRHLHHSHILTQMGSPQQGSDMAYRSSLAIITKRTSNGWCTLACDYKAAGEGPAKAKMEAADMLDAPCI